MNQGQPALKMARGRETLTPEEGIGSSSYKPKEAKEGSGCAGLNLCTKVGWSETRVERTERREITHGLDAIAALQRARVALIDHGRLISLRGAVVGGEPVVSELLVLGEGAGSGEGGENENDGSKGAGEHLGMKLLKEKFQKDAKVVELGLFRLNIHLEKGCLFIPILRAGGN